MQTRNPCQGTVSRPQWVPGCRRLAGVDAEHLGARPLACPLKRRARSPTDGGRALPWPLLPCLAAALTGPDRKAPQEPARRAVGCVRSCCRHCSGSRRARTLRRRAERPERDARRVRGLPSPRSTAATGDISRVGMAAHLAGDVSTPALSHQEPHTCDDATHEVFPGTPAVHDGCLWPSLEPGLRRRLRRQGRVPLPPVNSAFDRWAAGVRRPGGSLEPR
jgi:hypothetical protein